MNDISEAVRGAHEALARQKRSEQLANIIAEKHLAPPGKLGLSPLLDARRAEFGIIDACFNVQCAFDRVLLWQIQPAFDEGDTYGGSSIIMTDNEKRRTREEAPRGVLVGAGLKALDNLRCNGIDLGHIVHFVRLSPWRLPVDRIDGTLFHVLILRDADIIGSEDLAMNMRKGLARIQLNDNGEHVLGGTIGSSAPLTPDDY